MAQFYRVACGCLLLSGILFGQDRPRFEVASIRPSSEQVNAVNIGLRQTGSQVRITAMSLKDYIGLAYTVIPQQISGPEWIAQLRFDVAATIPEGAGAAEKVPEMMQGLLADRFQLKIHRESREFQVYALGGGASFVLGNNKLEARKLTMAQFADLLTRFYDRPIIDATGLKGRYDVTLDVAPEDYMGMMIRSAVGAGIPLPPQAN
jgi:hypothetical protein